MKTIADLNGMKATPARDLVFGYLSGKVSIFNVFDKYVQFG